MSFAHTMNKITKKNSALLNLNAIFISNVLSVKLYCLRILFLSIYIEIISKVKQGSLTCSHSLPYAQFSNISKKVKIMQNIM